MTNWLVCHVVSGDAFFTGVVCVLFGVFASLQSHVWLKRCVFITFLCGVLLMIASSTALPIWLYFLAGVASFIWLVSYLRKLDVKRWGVITITCWLIAVCAELPFHLPPNLAPVSDRSITIIGDSVTAGVGGDETSERWPHLLAAQHDISVQDISQIGETAASALKRVRSETISGSIVIIEIGGNDILGSTSPQKFEADLAALITELDGNSRQLVMLELPLPPGFHWYGYIQRRIAKEYNVKLIPRRIFANVLFTEQATLDSIHLSQAGHQKMSAEMWSVIAPAFE